MAQDFRAILDITISIQPVIKPAIRQLYPFYEVAKLKQSLK